MPVENCKRCRRLFQKTSHSNCPECLKVERDEMREVYVFVQEHPGVPMAMLAETFGKTMQTMEQMVYAGNLGTANRLISAQCARCKLEMTALNRIGRFCYQCNTRVEREATSLKQAAAPEKSPQPERRLAPRQSVASAEGVIASALETATVIQPVEMPTGSDTQTRYSFKRVQS